MKRPKFKYVAQVENMDCMIACIAMVTGHSLKQIGYYFKNDFKKKGTSSDFAIRYIENSGISVIEKRSRGFLDLSSSNKLLLKPFADIHIITGADYIDIKNNHAVVMSKKGIMFDPSDKTYKDWKLFYEIHHAIGCYYL